MCQHQDFPCCGCDPDHVSLQCPECGELFCVCDEDERDDEDLDESMDGDHESGLASAGFGTDESYDHYDDYGDWGNDGDY